ncbi:MAG: hypothetical protein Q8J64_02275, partial [Thermodesulfovibrionales bacterium]|nr:hypothetical protein [Thermodesulfovibrionales bacterium]
MGKASMGKKIKKTTTYAPEKPTESAAVPSMNLLVESLRKPFVPLVLIALLGILAYSNTFNAPFQWDEQKFIVNNPIVKDLVYFIEPSTAENLELYPALKGRYVGYLTFALNFKIHGLDVRGYHVVNILIHIINSLLVYFLVLLTFRTPYLNNPLFLNNPPSPPLAKGGLSEGNLIALFSALLFVSHPIQTEAVTYIFQRLASLCAFFYLLSLLLYIKSRLTEKNTRYAFYALSLLSAVLAMKTKENAFTLPLVITLYEFFFFKGSIKSRALRLVPILLTMLIIPLSLIGIDKPVGEIISGIGTATEGYQGISRWDYFLTQFRVIVTYIRLLFLPINQNIDYDYPVFHSFFDLGVLLSFFFLLSVFGSAVYLFYHSKNNPSFRLISFGVFWFFITLSVESSIIPIPMVINEYRLYLPSFGAFAAAAGGALILLKGL